MGIVNGIGLGLRAELGNEMLERAPEEIRWVEVHPENYVRRGGRFATLLARARDVWPVATHGLTMCFGAVEPFEREYMEPLRRFLHEVETPWHSDHMCFGGVDGVYAHDLLPVPFNESSLETMARRITEARDFLDREVAFENVSYYAESPLSETDEASFTVALLERTDCRMLLDVNNVYVNSRNHGFDPRAWIDRIPADRVVQIHVAGHFVRDDDLRIDTHAENVCDDVYDLLEHTLERMGPKPVLLERDGNFPKLDDLLAQVRRLGEIYARATSEKG